MIQLDLFEPNDPIALERRGLAEMRELVLKCNRAQFAKLHSLGKEVIKLSNEIDTLRNLLLKEK